MLVWNTMGVICFCGYWSICVRCYRILVHKCVFVNVMAGVSISSIIRHLCLLFWVHICHFIVICVIISITRVRTIINVLLEFISRFFFVVSSCAWSSINKCYIGIISHLRSARVHLTIVEKSDAIKLNSYDQILYFDSYP